MLPKNIATSLKSEKFLKFFFTRLQKNNMGIFTEYEYISPCGNEMNFIRPADTPICFNELRDGELVYAQTMTQRFEPDMLHFCTDTERLYHPLFNHKRLRDNLCLISSHLAIKLSATFVPLESCHSGIGYDYNGTTFPVLTTSVAERTQGCP
mmetsp:Transcript_2081/g.2380  ORF Transcript_2081/g.2380 Transcript_2081/m.2380 type:complete len:152 (+) Transcript_2081:425-880(+)